MRKVPNYFRIIQTLFFCENKENQNTYIRSEIFKILFVLFSVNFFINIF